MIKCLLFIVLVLETNLPAFGQQYFNKYVEPIGDLNPNPSALIVNSSQIIVQSFHVGNLTVLTELGPTGEFIDTIGYQNFGNAENGLLSIDENYWMWGKDGDQEKGLKAVRLTNDLDISATTTIMTPGAWNFASASSIFRGNLAVLSLFRDEGSSQLMGSVHVLSQDLELLWSSQLHPTSTFVNVFNSLELSSGNLLVSSQDKSEGAVTIFNASGAIQRQRKMSEEIESGFPVSIVELSNGNVICGTVVDRRQDYEYIMNDWYGFPAKYYWLESSSLQELSDTIYIDPKLERPGIERLWKGNGDYFFIYGNIWYVSEDQTYGMLKKVDNDGNILWSRRYQHEDFTGSENFHGIEHIQEMPDGSIYTAGTAKFSPGRNHIWVMHLDENGCLGSGDCGEVVITDVEDIPAEPSEIVLYPNPASDIITLDHIDYSLTYTYTITDVSGSAVERGSIENKKQQTIDVSRYSSGLYVLSLSTGAESDTTIKFVVHR